MSGTGPAIPAKLGKYEIRGLLGRGAMGVVYDGWDPAIDRRIAIKTVSLLPSDDEAGTEALARFRREAQAAGRLHHPNIVSVFDYGETDDLAFIVMEFVEGRTLKDLVTGNERMASSEAIRLMSDILAGLDYSHERGVVHRDIKPANIMLTASGQAKIADFGIARIESSSMTQAGTVMGTPAYMSPEQFMGHVVDRRTDIYSCGVILYQLLAGERPFDGSLSSIMHKVMTTKPPPPSALTVTAPRALDAVVATAMAVRPEDRYPTAPAFAEALRAPPPPVAAPDDDATMIAPRAVATPAPVAATVPPPVRKSSARTGVIVGAVVLLGLGGGAAWFLLGRKADDQPAPSQTASISPAPSPAAPPIALPPAKTPEPVAEAPKAVSPPAETASTVPPSPLPSPAPTPAPTPSASPPAPLPRAPVEAFNTVPPAAAPPETPPAKVLTPPVPPPVVARSPAEVASLLGANLPNVACSLTRVGVGPGGVTVSGLAGAGDPAGAVRKAAAEASPAGVDWQIRTVDGVYCATLDLLRSVPETPSSAVSLEQEGGAAPLTDDQVIGLRVTMPGFAGYLQMAYVQSNATVSPLVPSADYPSQTYAARASILLGQPRGSFAGWRAGPPFGTDMVVAVVSTAPLFTRPQTADLPLDTYLANLGTAIQALRKRGGSVTAAAAVIETKPGPATPAR